MEPQPQRYLVVFAFCSAWSACCPLLGQTWTQTGAPSNSWMGVACSADGSRLVAATRSFPTNGQIYISSDSGTNWVLSSAPTLPWFSLSASADGTRMAAQASGFRIYTSTNAGATWSLSRTSLSTAGAGAWQSLASSADGSALATANYTSAIFLSANVGSSWRSQATPLSDVIRVALSADGVRLVAANNNGGLIVSTNAGANWSAIQPGGQLISLAGSADLGSLVVAASGLGFSRFRILASTNMGQTWVTNNLPATNWITVAASADGSKFVAVASSGAIYTGSGATWTSNSAPALDWQAVASTADGNALFAAPSNGSIWVRRTAVAPMLRVTRANDGLRVSWVLPSSAFKLQQTSLLTAEAWTDITNTPTLNNSNLNNEVVFPWPDSNTFYRLKNH